MDERFADNPAVLDGPRIRFYAGCPLIDQAGFALGTLCVIDQKPRTLSDLQRANLHELATAMVRLLEARKIDNALFAAELAAKSTRADLTIMLDSVTTAIAYWGVDLRNRYANKAVVEWYGGHVDHIKGGSVPEAFGASVFADNPRAMAAALEGEPQAFERAVRTEDGTTRHLYVAFTPDVREGKVRGFVATGHDVTDLKAALLTSQRRNDLLSLAEAMAEVGHWRYAVATELLYWSPQVYRIHGRSPNTFIPTLARGIEAYHPDDRARVSELVQRAVDRREPFSFDLRIVRPDGSIRRVECRGRSELDPASGATVALVGVFQDVTERDQLRERSARRDRLVATGTLAAGVGHEINNPLTYVIANVEFAIDELTALAGPAPSSRMGEVRDALVEAKEGAGRIGKIVRGLKAFAREEGPLAATDVYAAIQVAIDMAVHELRNRATVTTELGDVPQVVADESRLSQVLVSLLVNSAQSFKTSDLARNRIVVRSLVLPDGRVAIEVQDNGAGIPEDVLPRIYDPFFTTKTVGLGSGLGLAIAHAIVTSLGGEIACTSQVGAGTTFRVALAAAPDPGKQPSQASPKRSATRRGKVLVIDDEPSVLRMVARALQSEHEVVTVNNTVDALRILSEEGLRFDVIFCDLMMQVMTGIDLYRRVSDERPALAKRFVFVTGGSADDDLRAFLSEVPNERLEKPFGNEILREVTRRLLG